MANFLETKFNQPLFLLSKIQLKKKTAYPLKKYVEETCHLYACDCLESKQLASTRKRYETAIAGYERRELAQNKCKPLSWSKSKSQRKYFSFRHDTLAPNRYNVTASPYAKYKGSFGSFWQPLQKTISRQKELRKYSVVKTKKINYINRCDEHKNILMPDARNYKSGVRIMVSTLAGCPRPIDDPSPFSYYPKTHEINYEHEKRAHMEYLKSMKEKSAIQPIPKKWNRVFPKQNMDFQPGPGHYENRFRSVCICAKGKKIMPGLALEIEKEKRNKFRGLPYRKFKKSLYCNPDWSHVKGRGFRRIFLNAPPMPIYKSKKLSALNKLSDFAKYADAKYMRLIKFPKRDVLSIREAPITFQPKKPLYNSLLQHFVNRRIMRSEKKIAFQSKKARFPDYKPPPPITPLQLRSIIASLPPERQSSNYPVLLKHLKDIENRLSYTPAHMRMLGDPRIRKINFQFSPVPKPKLLFDEKEHYDKEFKGFFTRELNIAEYLLPEAKVTDQLLKAARALFKN